MNDDTYYKMIPNIAVQNILDGDITKNSFIQMFGKRTIAYLYQMFELQNNKTEINISINLLLKMLSIDKNIYRERQYLISFINSLAKDKLIEILSINNNTTEKNFDVDDVIKLKLNIYDYNKGNKVKNYFILTDSEFNTIMNNCSSSLDRYNLLNLFCNIKSRIKRNSNDISSDDRKPEVAYPSYETIMADIYIESDKTLKQYIDTLVELDLIRFDCAGDMKFHIDGQKPIRIKSNFTYTLFRPGWEIELENSISSFKNKKRKDGWSFLTKEKEIRADEKRSITQKINLLEKKKSEGILTQSQKKELLKLKRQKEKWQYNNDVDIRKLEEAKLKNENPEKTLTEIYIEKGYEVKAERAYEEETLETYINNVDILKKYISPNYKPYEKQLRLLERNETTAEQLLREEIEFYHYEDYVEFVKEQVNNNKIELCSCCGKNPIVKNNDICKSCLDELERSQYRAGQWKINNSNSFDDIDFEDLVG